MKDRNAPGHCNVTGNICGTDTWMQGFPCPCLNCQAYLAANESVARGANFNVIKIK